MAGHERIGGPVNASQGGGGEGHGPIHPFKGRGRDEGPLKSNVSIHDVAAAAKVSIATVSRVMNAPELVSEGTAKRVQEAIKKLGYVPNAMAQGLSSRVSHVVGLALPTIHGEFYSELLRGADSIARNRRYHLLVTTEHRGDDGPSLELAFGLVDGVAVMITEADASGLLDTNLPTVVIDADMTGKGLDSIVLDNASGTREAVEHLLSRTPAERCYFVGGPAGNYDTRERAEAFVAALAKGGHEARPEQVAYGSYDVEWGKRWGSGAAGAGRLRGAGVLAGNDEIAVGICEAAEDAGLRIPEDLRVVGFDDTRVASLMRPRLSSVKVPMFEAGAAAVEMLLRRVGDRDAEVLCRRLETRLVVRESSRGV